MEIRTERLTLRPLEKSDWQFVQRLGKDFESGPMRNYDGIHAVSEDDAQEQTRLYMEAGLFWIVMRSGFPVGMVNFYPAGDSYDLGYCFLSSVKGKGYARESCHALLAHYEANGVTRFTAGTALDNQPSVRLLLHLGFRLTGTERLWMRKDGEGREIWFDGGQFELNASSGYPKS
ncbi:MAG: GNAT family N-acetyltransferase [Clostridia bacterium]|nr:GNAT family N-acetyltransferase [Clostridia bacterium]